MSPATPLTQSTTQSTSRISDAQLQANRRNSQKSTGPKTEAGKSRARLNATRHGLTGQFHAFSEEDKAAYDEHCTALMADFNATTYREQSLAISIAEGSWRLSRARAMENNIFAIGMSGPIGDATDGDNPEVHAAICQARVWLQDGNKLQLLTLYESRIRRNIEKDQKELADLQAIRYAARDQALEEATLLAHLSISEGEIYDPAEDFPQQNGFEFSAVQINLCAHRELRLRKARLLQKQAEPKSGQTARAA